MGIDYLKERGFVPPTQHFTVNKNTSRQEQFIQIRKTTRKQGKNGW